MNLLNKLSPEEFLKTRRIDFHKGEILFAEGTLCKGVGILGKGKLHIRGLTESGKEILFHELNVGELFGHNLIFSDSPYYKGSVEASSDGYLTFIEKEELVNLFQRNEEFLLAYLKVQSEQGQRLNERIRILSMDGAREKLECLLWTHQGEMSYSSIASLAEELGLKRETLSRTIHQMKREGKLEIGNRRIRML